MGIMAACTTELSARPLPFCGPCYRVSVHRVSTFDASCQPRVTTEAEVVNRLKEHEFFIAGMRVMTNDTTRTKDNAMNIGYRLVFIQQDLFIIVTGCAKIKGTFSPELISVLTPMGIMAQGTSTDQSPMPMFAGQ